MIERYREIEKGNEQGEQNSPPSIQVVHYIMDEQGITPEKLHELARAHGTIEIVHYMIDLYFVRMLRQF